MPEPTKNITGAERESQSTGGDYGHVASLIRSAIDRGDEPTLRALLSNNVNMIVTALGLASWASARIKRLAMWERQSVSGPAEWTHMDEAPQDGTLIEVWVPCKHGLSGFISDCAWHPDAGFFVDELRVPAAWRTKM